jgi:hypothetical protein
MARKFFFTIIWIISTIVCFGIKLNTPVLKGAINCKSKVKLIPVQPPPGNPNIEIRGYSVDTINSKIYVAGKFKTYDGIVRQNLVRLNLATGVVESSWTPKCSGEVSDILFADNKIYIIGNLDTIAGVADRYAACLDTAGNFLWVKGNNDHFTYHNYSTAPFDNTIGKPTLIEHNNDIVAINFRSDSSDFGNAPIYGTILFQEKATAFNKLTGIIVTTNNFVNSYNTFWDNNNLSNSSMYLFDHLLKQGSTYYFTVRNNFAPDRQRICLYDGINPIISSLFPVGSQNIIDLDISSNMLKAYTPLNFDNGTDTFALYLFNPNTLSPIAISNMSSPLNYYYKGQTYVPIYLDPITSSPSSYVNNNVMSFGLTKDKRNNKYYFGVNKQGFKHVNSFQNYIDSVREPGLSSSSVASLNGQYQDTLELLRDVSMYNINSAEPKDFFVFQNKLINVSTWHANATTVINYINTYCLFTDKPIITNTAIPTTTASPYPTLEFCPNTNRKLSFKKLGYTVNTTYTFTGSNIAFNISQYDTLRFSAGSNATSGILKIVHNSDCGRVSDTLYINMVVLPKPNVIASLTTNSLSCFNPKVPILASSSTPSVSFSWIGPFGYTSNNQNDSTAYNKPGKYIVTVTNTITGCPQKDSVLVGMDTLGPVVTLPSSAVDLYCSPDSSLLNGSSSSPSPNIWWHIANSGVKHSNPYYTKNIGNYYMVVQNMANGCKDSSVFVVGDKRVLPNHKILFYNYPSTSLIPIDTITCIKNSITVTGASDTLNTIISWRNLITNAVFNNPLVTSSQGAFSLIIKRTDNGCADSSLSINIAQNITPPNISITTPSASINCSSSTATLNANTSFTTTSLNWSGPSGFTSSNPAVTSIQGKYYINAINSENGCIKKDSVVVNYTPTLIVHTNNDTTVCKNASVNLQANITGTLTGINYSWSNASSGQSINVNPNTTTQFIVTASSISGCSGKDTVVVTIPSDINDSIVSTKSCNGATVGSISIYVNGGVAPYLYSFNGGAFTTQTSYTNLPYATYPISIKDALGCTKNTSGSINQNSSLPVPLFIASTQNIQGDTIVLIDLTVPKADSVQWLLPSAASIVGGDMFNPLVFFADTGNFVITLTAFYADCDISSTKNIHVGPVDTTMASLTNNNGVKSITLYPNPNTGLFTADIEFYKKQNSTVQIFDAVAVKDFQQNFFNTDFISLPVDVTALSNGTYIFKVVGEYNSKHVNFVISK